MPFDNRPINIELLNAITTRDTNQVIELLNNGANPTATVDLTGRLPEGGKRNVLFYAFFVNYPRVVDVILKHTEKCGKEAKNYDFVWEAKESKDPNKPIILDLEQIDKKLKAVIAASHLSPSQ